MAKVNPVALEMEEQSLQSKQVDSANIPMADPGPIEPFTISKQTLVDIVAYSGQKRVFADELDFMEQQWETNIVEQMEKGLCTSLKNGITSSNEDLQNRKKAFGHNEKPPVELKGFFQLLLLALDDFTLKVLVVSSIVSIVIEVSTAESDHRSTSWIEGFAILMAVAISSTVQATNDYQKERQFQALNQVADERKKVSCIRNGVVEIIHQTKLLVGDIVQIFEGMEIPADGIVLEASEVMTDESSMTGETDPLKKNTIAACIQKRNEIRSEGEEKNADHHSVPSPILLSGTKILGGEGLFMVAVVGDSSSVGKIDVLLRQETDDTTPLQQKLEAIARDIGMFGLISAIIIVSVLLIRFAVERIIESNWNHDEHWGEMLRFFIIGITVVVVAIPEGLPLSVTLSLAFSVKKMLKDKNLVRKLQACETMGGADCICSDKTGTLTQNVMTLVKIWNKEEIDCKAYEKKFSLSEFMPKSMEEMFLQQCCLNSSAVLRPTLKGSKTEIAILQFIDKTEYNYEDIKQKYDMVLKYPFSSNRKRMGFIFRQPNNQLLLLQKGASEMVVSACDKFQSFNGATEPLEGQIKQDIDKAITQMAEQSLRTIAVAFKNLSEGEDLTSKDKKGVHDIEKSGLTLFCLLGIKDIVREEVPGAVLKCEKAGIKVRMVTGDNKITAKAIAKECNIFRGNDIVMEGVDFITEIGGIVCKKCRTEICDCPRDKKTAKEKNCEIRIDTVANGQKFDEIVPRLSVLARSRPEDKYALVTGLIERKHVVAVTGDGTNDAPALKKADVGFAMGIAGTQVAREAAAIILLDDNFNSIVKAVLWGRNIYDSIRKFLQFQLTVNVVAVGVTLIGAALLQMEILKAIQMLWINLIMDTLASLALATEPPHEKLLDRKPHNRDDYIISKKMFKHILGQSIYQVIVIMILVFSGESWIPEKSDSFDTDKPSELSKKYQNWKSEMVIQKSDSSGKDVYSLFDKGQNEGSLTVISGRFYELDGSKAYYDIYKFDQYPSRHFTVIFNTFVWLQICNFVNARKIFDEYNILQGIFSNSLFILIVGIVIVLQIFIVSFGGIAFCCYRFSGDEYFGGCTAVQWIIAVAFGLGSNIVTFIIKPVSEEVFCSKCQTGKKQVDPVRSFSRLMSMRKSQNQSDLQKRYHQNQLEGSLRESNR